MPTDTIMRRVDVFVERHAETGKFRFRVTFPENAIGDYISDRVYPDAASTYQAIDAFVSEFNSKDPHIQIERMQ